MNFNQIRENTVSAEKQLKPNENIRFINPYGKGKRILFLGNSITLHGVKEDIGWFNEWGMAASAEENDYVHLVVSDVQKTDSDAAFCICQAAIWEINYKNGESVFPLFESARNFDADIIIMRIVENCPTDDFEKETFKSKLEKFLNYLSPSGNATVIFTTGFWHHPGDEMIEETAKETSSPLVLLGDLGEKDEMKAIGLFEHKGVSHHPGDFGMKNIADRIFKEIEKLI